jgi:hypothetical protein
MAKQTGIIKLKGTIGGISFYKTSDGHLAREKGGVDKNRIQNDPAFQRTRENGSEFGRAGKGGKVLRNAIRILLQNAKDKRVVSRLTKSLVAVSAPTVATTVNVALGVAPGTNVITPASVTTAVSLEAQVTTEECNPLLGKVKFEVTSFKFVNNKAVVASATKSASVGPVGVSSLHPATANTNVNAVNKVNSFFIFFLHFLLINETYTI